VVGRTYLLKFIAVLAAAALLVGASDGGTAVMGVVVASGSPFQRTCAPHAVRGYLVEPTATTVTRSGVLVAAWQADRAYAGADGIVAARSLDGGRRWSSHVVPGLARCEGGQLDAVSDPWLSAGPDGTVYLLTDAVTGPQATIAVSRSLDEGRSWQPPAVLEQAEFLDKPTITADPYVPGVAFAVWEDVNRGAVIFSRTLDAGRSWSSPRVVTQPFAGAPALPEIGVLPNGTLTLVTSGRANGRRPFETLEHLAQTSTDLGASWSQRAVIDHLTTLPAPFRRTRISARAELFSLASGPQGVYLVSALLDSPRQSRLVISHQQPDGAWSRPRTTARINKLAVLPTVAVNGSNRLAVTWDAVTLSTRSVKALATVTAAVSDDDGLTWTTHALGQPFQLPQQIDRVFFIGDYQALTTTRSGFDAIDISTRRGRHKLRTFVESFTFG
jgi:hypothetical protein